MKLLRTGLKVTISSGLVFAFGFAHADVKIVAHLHGTAMGHAVPESSSTTYYKGDKMRSDQFGRTLLFDAKTAKVDVLRPDDKTYFEVGDADVPPFMKNGKLDATATVTSTDEHKTIAGLSATKYVVDLHLTITQSGADPQKIDMSVELWTTTDLKTPFIPSHLFRGLAQYLRGVSFADVSQVVTEMEKVKGFPLEENISLSGIPGLPAITADSGTGPVISIVISADTVTEAPLGDDIFAVPADYKKVDPPVGAGGG